MNCNKGYVFYEGLIAIFLVMVMLSTIFPVLLQLQFERVAIRQEREAISLMQGLMLNRYQTPDDPLPIELNGKNQTYGLHVDELDESIRYCLRWEGRNDREQSWCLSSFRY